MEPPVLLVHGANQDADLAWADPNGAGDYGCGRASCPSSGLDIALLHNEHTGPSDGVLFIASYTDTTGIATHGGSATVAVNHRELGWAATAVNQIVAWLEAP